MDPDDDLVKAVLPTAPEETEIPKNETKEIDVSLLEIGFEVETPSGDLVCLFPVSTQEVILSLKILLQELPGTCQYTCYTLINPSSVELNDYVEIREYLQKGILVSGMRLKMQEEDYTVRQVRQHVRKIRELLLYPIGYPEQTYAEAAAEMKEILKIVDPNRSENHAQRSPQTDEERTSPFESSDTTLQKDQENHAQINEKKEANGVPSFAEVSMPGDQTSKAELAALHRQRILKNAKTQLKELRNRIPDLEIPFSVSLNEFYEVVIGGVSTIGERNLRDMLQGGFARKDGGPPGGIDASPTPCLKGLCFSGWNPPPPPRRLMGDLAYLEVSTLDDGVLHITATPFGFYVNRTSHVTFDPMPAANPCQSHSLLPLLEQASPSFRKAWAGARQQATKRGKEAQGPLDVLALMVGEGRIDALTGCPQWNVATSFKSSCKPGCRHKLDLNRMEEDLLNTFGMDERGALRDWNEEYQSIIELPDKNLEDRLIKARALHKILSDFHEAAVQGAKGIVEQQVAPLNPMEPEATHVYAFNNIFFSYALDSRHAYNSTGGDSAANANANHDLRNVVALNKAGIKGLSTLATSIIDFLGVRLVAQSIIPGILTGDHRDKLVYGAVEYGLSLQKKDSKLANHIKQVSERFLIAERPIPVVPIPGCISESTVQALAEAETSTKDQGEDGNLSTSHQEVNEETIVLASAVEVKGILGADGRRYILDLVRLTPRDANWVPISKNGTGVYSADQEYGPEVFTAILRTELVILWARHKVALWSSEKRKEILEGGGQEGRKVKRDSDEEVAEHSEHQHGSLQNEDQKEQTLTKAEFASLKSMSEDYVKSLGLNVNAFMPYAASTSAEEIAKDEENIRDVSYYLWNNVLPGIITDVKRGVLTGIVDGKSLTDTLHSVGANIRYLGRLAYLAQKEEIEDAEILAEGMVRRHQMPIWWLELLEIEMIARALKRILFDLLKDRPDIRILPGPSLLRMLNCLLGNPEGLQKDDILKDIETAAAPFSKPKKMKGKGKKNGKSPLPFTGPIPILDVSHASLWDCIKLKVKKKFRYELFLWKDAGWDKGQRCQRTLHSSLLRRVCQCLGLRVASRNYEWGGGCPFAVEDLIDIHPVPKHCLPSTPFPEASHHLEVARLHLATGNLGLAFEVVQNALAQLQMVCGGTHKEVASALEISSMIFFQANDVESCMAQGQKALAFYSQLLGFDSPQAIACHGTLALLLASSKYMDKAIAHLKAFIYLVETAAGPHHPEVTSAYQRMGVIFQEVGDLKRAMKCYNELLKRDVCDKPTQAQIWHNMALILHQAGDFENAVASERSSFAILKGLYGEKDARTIESTFFVKRFTEAAVEDQKIQDTQKLASIEEHNRKITAKKKSNGKGKIKKKKKN